MVSTFIARKLFLVRWISDALRIQLSMTFEYLYNSLSEIMHIVLFQHCFSALCYIR